MLFVVEEEKHMGNSIDFESMEKQIDFMYEGNVNAMAVLHLYGIEQYSGEKKYVKYMIESKMDI